MKKVAILVPTMNRIDFVIRLIHYYVSIDAKHPIFIGDASSESSEELVLKAAQNKLEVFYYHWEKLNDRKTMVELAKKAHLVNITDYCVFSGDDDFFIEKSLSQCAEFLDENIEFATSQGRAFRFKLNKDGPYGQLLIIDVYWDVKELNGVTALERLNEITSDYWVPNFSVHRIEEFIEDIGNGIDTIIDRDFGEYSNSLTMAMRGKSKFIDCLYLARNVHSSIDHPTRAEWMKSENWKLSYIELVKSVSKVLSQNDNLSKEESNLNAEMAVDILTKPQFNRDNSILVLIRKTIKDRFIDKRGFISRLYLLYRNLKKILSNIFPSKGFSRKSLLSPKSEYYKDVCSIIDACKKGSNIN